MYQPSDPHSGVCGQLLIFVLVFSRPSSLILGSINSRECWILSVVEHCSFRTGFFTLPVLTLWVKQFVIVGLFCASQDV